MECIDVIMLLAGKAKLRKIVTITKDLLTQDDLTIRLVLRIW